MRVRFGAIPWCMCVVVVMDLCDRRVGAAWRHTPLIHDDPDRRPNRGDLYPHWAIATFALPVWQGDTPDSGEAVIMGVP